MESRNNMEYLILFLLFRVVIGFEVTDRYPPLSESGRPHKVAEGSTVTLSCSSSRKFNLCRWDRPGSQSPCAIFSTADKKKNCAVADDDMSKWTVRRGSDKTCLMEIEAVGPDEAGEWNCELQSYPNDDGKYESAQEYTRLALVEPAVVELKGPLELVLYEGETAEFHCKASGDPLPKRFNWAIGRMAMEDLKVENTEEKTGLAEQTVSAVVSSAWSGKKLACIATQEDDEGKVIERSDERTIRVERRRNRVAKVNADASRYSGEFSIVERYPDGVHDTTPEFLLAEGEPVTFSCTSSLPWHVCRWKRPDSSEPCGLLSDDVQGKSCNGVWTNNEESWNVRVESPTTCTLTGTSGAKDEGEWNCDLQSKPILNEHNVYDSDQQYFAVRLIRPAEVKMQLPPEFELTEGDSVEIEFEIAEAFPQPEVRWFLNSREFEPRVVKKSKPGRSGAEGDFSQKQTVRYTADLEDSGKKLIFVSTQMDAEGRAVEKRFETFLNIRALPPPPEKQTMGAGIVAAIISIAAFIILVIILLIVAFRTGKLCFPSPAVVDEKDQGHMEIQTEAYDTADTGTSAAFGPAKPGRKWDTADDRLQGEGAPLVDPELGQSTFTPDEHLHFRDEGLGSLAGSLPSLNTDASDTDWKDTMRVLGPKFSHLADMVYGDGDDDGEEQGRMTTTEETTTSAKERKMKFKSNSEV